MRIFFRYLFYYLIKLFLIVKSFIILPLKAKNLIKYQILFYSNREFTLNFFFKKDSSLENFIKNELQKGLKLNIKKYIKIKEIIVYNLLRLIGIFMFLYSFYNFIRNAPVDSFYYGHLGICITKKIIEAPFLLLFIIKSKRFSLLLYWFIVTITLIIVPLLPILIDINIFERFLKKQQ